MAAGAMLLVVSLMSAAVASAETPTTICVPEAANKPVLSGSAGKCTKAKYNAVALPGTGGLATLNKILPHINYVESGVGGKPTIQFSGVNVQVVNGEGKTDTVNGEGNLVIGYDENGGGHAQTGSHDLVLGHEQTFTSFGGIVAGRANTISGPFASVTGGFVNTASGEYASVSGGLEGNASALLSWVGGGGQNKATFREASVSGGYRNEASGENASVSGGVNNKASALFASVSGGELNRASGERAWVGGGFSNNASGRFASIFGGKELTASAPFEAIP
jgi:hypothetical protein